MVCGMKKLTTILACIQESLRKAAADIMAPFYFLLKSCFSHCWLLYMEILDDLIAWSHLGVFSLSIQQFIYASSGSEFPSPGLLQKKKRVSIWWNAMDISFKNKPPEPSWRCLAAGQVISQSWNNHQAQTYLTLYAVKHFPIFYHWLEPWILSKCLTYKDIWEPQDIVAFQTMTDLLEFSQMENHSSLKLQRSSCHTPGTLYEKTLFESFEDFLLSTFVE